MKKMKPKNITIDDLALMVAKGFDEVHSEISGVREELSGQINSLREDLGGKISSLAEEFYAFREEVRIEFKRLWFEIDQINHQLDRIEKNGAEEIELISSDIIILKSKVKELELKVKKIKLAS